VAVVSALDIRLAVTRFPNKSALSCTRLTMSLREFAMQIPAITAATKAALPFYKFAKFGDDLSPRRSYRHDRNVLEVSGLEFDYDLEVVSVAAAAAALHAARIPGVLVTTASHRPEAPHWRLFCPLSRPVPPEARAGLISRVAGALPEEIAFAAESWTCSQAFYVGVAADAPAPLEVVLIDE
jgi:hypothetical protein